MQDGSLVVLGMPDIDELSPISVNCETIGRQVMADDITDNSKRNGQCQKAIQIEGGEYEQFESEKQDAEAQSQKMQTIQPSQLLLLIQWSRVTITIRMTSLQRQ